MVEYDVFILFGIAVFAILIFVFCIARLFGRKPQYAVLDGSNVMHWVGDEARLDTLRTVIAQLEEVGLLSVIWFDANVGYKLGDRYVGPEALANALKLPHSQVHVAPKGTPADPLLLATARKLRAPIVSNDRFRDWQEEFPELRDAAYMIRGRIQGDLISLDVREGLTAR